MLALVLILARRELYHLLALSLALLIIIIIIIIIFIYCNWVDTRWQWLFYMYTKYEIGYY